MGLPSDRWPDSTNCRAANAATCLEMEAAVTEQVRLRMVELMKTVTFTLDTRDPNVPGGSVPVFVDKLVKVITISGANVCGKAFTD